MSVVLTYSGRFVDPLALRASDVRLVDLAHGLAYSSRYNGHARSFYSIAQHSVLVSRLLELRDYSADTQLWGLMHDTAEAYLGDVVSPLKANLAVNTAHGLESFAEVEARALDAIADALALPLPYPERIVKAADREVLSCEADALFSGDLTAWRLEYPAGAIVVDPWPAEEAERRFISRWRELAELRDELRASA